MFDLLRMIFGLVVDLFPSRAPLEAEILVRRQQIVVLQCGRTIRLQFVAADRLAFFSICRLFPKALDALAIVRPETMARWHRTGLHVLSCYLDYYNLARTHLSLGKDAPIHHAVQSVGHILTQPVLGGLHHQYARI
jgi:hypothetical protein